MEPKDVRKRYCDRNFKTQLARTLKMNSGEPGHFERIKSNKHIACYTSEKIVDFTNSVASDVQKFVNSSLASESQQSKSIVELTQLMEDISGGNKPQELPLAMKLHSNFNLDFNHKETGGVDFEVLNKFLYLAVNGTVDFADFNEETKAVLYDTYDLLMKQVENYAPNCLEDIKSKIGKGNTEEPPERVSNLATIFQDKTLNPFNLPFEYLMNGSLPEA